MDEIVIFSTSHIATQSILNNLNEYYHGNSILISTECFLQNYPKS